jgi:hypothetical protein
MTRFTPGIGKRQFVYFDDREVRYYPLVVDVLLLGFHLFLVPLTDLCTSS